MTTQKQVQRKRRDRLARVVDSGLPVVGVSIVLGAVMLGGGGWGPLWMAVAGLLMVEAGVWRLGSRVVRGRRYLPLRREVERFIELAPQLHRASAAVAENPSPSAQEALDATLAAMRRSLDRMADVAAKTDEDLAAEEEAGEGVDDEGSSTVPAVAGGRTS